MFHCIMASHYSVSLHWSVYLFVTLCSFWFKCKKCKTFKNKVKKQKKQQHVTTQDTVGT